MPIPTQSQPTPTLAVVNESQRVNETQAWNAAWAIRYQIKWQAGPLLKIAANVILAPDLQHVPPGAWLLHLVEKAGEGALGYHDEDGNEIPFGIVGVEDALNAKLTFEEVLSHEALELLYDPHVNLSAYDEQAKRLYPAELCDPVQGFSYDLGDPYGRHVGITVADFVLADWFDSNTHPDAFTDYRNVLKGPFALGHEGYVSYATTLPPNWQQEFGEHSPERAKEVSDRDDRVRRRLGAALA